MTPPGRLAASFFNQSTLSVAKGLLGQHLVRIDSLGRRLSGMIVETEAYVGTQDLACHAKSGKTKRNEVMWGPPGRAYVYFTYGMHWMLNIVTEPDGFPAAVLLRAIWPLKGIPHMQERRRGRSVHEIADGPAKLCQAFGIDGTWNGHDLCADDSPMFIERGDQASLPSVTTGPRVGLNNVPEPWKSKPWRFQIDPETILKRKKEDSR